MAKHPGTIWRLTTGCALLTILLMPVLAVPYRQQHQRKAAKPAIKSPEKRWHTFRSSDGDFRIQFPSKPQREEDIQGLFAMIRRYSSTTDTYYFGIVYQDVGPEASNLKPTHEETVSALLQERGYKIISIRRLARNITQVELWSPSQTADKYLHRIERTVVSHGRMYTIACASRIAEQEVDKIICRRFFNSFHITGAPR